MVVSIRINPEKWKNIKEFEEKSEYISTVCSLCNRTITRGDEVDINIKQKNKATYVLIAFPDKFIDESPRGACNTLYQITSIFGCGEISIITKSDNRYDVCIFTEEELSKDGRKKDSVVEYWEELKNKQANNELKEIDITDFEFKPFTPQVPDNFIYLCGKLMMFNINSTVEIDDDSLEYMNHFVNEWLLSLPNANIPSSDDAYYKMFPYSRKLPDIPILLKKEMPSYDILWEDSKKKDGDEKYIPKGAVLGYYSRGGKKDFLCTGPHIVLCPENILSEAEACKIPFNVLITKVLVHEIAHALMDKYRTVDGFGIRFTDSSKNWPYTVEAKAMEESLANAITLDAFGKHALFKDYRYVRHYMDNMQSSLYKFGLWQERIHADWEKWRNHSKENSDELEKWFNDCFNDGKIIIPKEDYTPPMYDCIFDKDS